MMKKLLIFALVISLAVLSNAQKGQMTAQNDTLLTTGYKSTSGMRSIQKHLQQYRLDTIDGKRVITLDDRALGDEELKHLEIIKAVKKRSTVLYRALVDSVDSVVLIDINPEFNQPYQIGKGHLVKARLITRLSVPYHSLPLKAFIFENDTIWQHFDDHTPMYLRIDDNIRLKDFHIVSDKLTDNIYLVK